jgi:hypothetical protein
MNHGVYTVMKESNEWTISAAGIRVIACRDRRTAIKTVRRAAELLRTDGNDPSSAAHPGGSAFKIPAPRPSRGARNRARGV